MFLLPHAGSWDRSYSRGDLRGGAGLLAALASDSGAGADRPQPLLPCADVVCHVCDDGFVALVERALSFAAGPGKRSAGPRGSGGGDVFWGFGASDGDFVVTGDLGGGFAGLRLAGVVGLGPQTDVCADSTFGLWRVFLFPTGDQRPAVARPA